MEDTVMKQKKKRKKKEKKDGKKEPTLIQAERPRLKKQIDQQKKNQKLKRKEKQD